MTDFQEDRLDPRHYLRLVWRWKWLLLAVIVLIPAGVYLLSSNLSKTYEASTVVKVEEAQASSLLFSNQVSFAGSSTEEVARVIETTLVAKEAAKRLGEAPATAPSLRGAIDAQPDEAAEPFLTITARAADPNRAADIANAFADAIATTRTRDAIRNIDQTIETLTEQASGGDPAAEQELAQQLQQLRAARATQASATQVLEPAAAPGAPISPNPKRNATLALVFALLLAVGVVVLLERMDRRLRETDELEKLVGAPLLGMIPDAAFPGRPPGPQVREAFQTFRAGLTYFNIDRALGSVLITSPTHGEGKTTVATNLAIALAQDERDVILVDADLRRPAVAKRLGVDGDVYFGIDAVLVEHRSLDDALVEVDVGGGRLRILPGASPTPNPTVLLGSQRMRSMLAKLSEQADIVIIDTPPLLSVSDAIPLLEQVSGAVLIARLDHTSRDLLRRARRLIASTRGTVFGVVATGIRAGVLYGYDGYGYGYGYDTAADGDQAWRANGAVKKRRGLVGRRRARKRSKAAARSQEPARSQEAAGSQEAARSKEAARSEAGERSD